MSGEHYYGKATDPRVRRRIQILERRCQDLWDRTSMNGRGGYRTLRDQELESRRQAAARELQRLRQG